MKCADADCTNGGDASEESYSSVATPPLNTKTKNSATSHQWCKQQKLTHAKAFATKIVMDNMDIVIGN